MARTAVKRKSAAVLVAAGFVFACGGTSSPAAPSVPAAVTAGANGAPTAGSAALPAGWVWPFDPMAIARGLAPFTVYRPVNAMALREGARDPQACGPVEVAPGVWVTPMCTRLPPLSRSPRAQSLAPASGITGAHDEIPASFDLRTSGLDGPMKNQQSADVCWSFALSSAMDNALRRVSRSEVLAPLHLVAHFEWGTLHREGVGHPIVPEIAWPYDPHKACKLDQNTRVDPSCERAYGVKRGSWRDDPPLIAERDRANASGAYKILAIHPLKTRPGDPDEIARSIASGHAPYVELEINMRAWTVSNLLAGGVVQDWQPDGTGGHAVVVTGYQTVAGGKRMFLVHNSWGSSWGDAGYGWISEDMIRGRVNDAFVITLGDAQGRLLSGGAPPPPPPPPPPPTSPVGPTGSRTQCMLSGLSDGGNTTSRVVPVGESICTASNAGGPSPGPWLHVCRKVSSGASNCASSSRQTQVCVAEVIGGRSQAACCPAGARRPTDPGCISAEVLHPPRSSD